VFRRKSPSLCLASFAVFLIGGTSAAKSAYPKDIQSFVESRDVCDQFRGEPVEGDSAEQKDRRMFVIQEMKRYCHGTDDRLNALKKKYSKNRQVMKKLDGYENKVER
jgi:hypothetical protein